MQLKHLLLAPALFSATLAVPNVVSSAAELAARDSQTDCGLSCYWSIEKNACFANGGGPCTDSRSPVGTPSPGTPSTPPDTGDSCGNGCFIHAGKCWKTDGTCPCGETLNTKTQECEKDKAKKARLVDTGDACGTGCFIHAGKCWKEDGTCPCGETLNKNTQECVKDKAKMARTTDPDDTCPGGCLFHAGQCWRKDGTCPCGLTLNKHTQECEKKDL